jgi:thiamine biosynthesis lipoprotein
MNLNAIAKGWIVDAAVSVAMEDPAATGITVNAGGDIVHRSAEALVIGIEDPRRPYDNVPPLARIRLEAGALATSGTTRRGWEIGGRWYSHVIDPRSGWPVRTTCQASVVADDAAAADAIATTLTVLGADEVGPFGDIIDGVAFLRIDEHGRTQRNEAWERLEVT